MDKDEFIPIFSAQYSEDCHHFPTQFLSSQQT